MIIKTKGLIINSTDYQDNACISLILTDNELKKYIIRGAKKLTTSTHALSQPLTRIDFNQTDKETLPLLTEGKVINNYTDLKDNLIIYQSIMIIFDKIKYFNESLSNIKSNIESNIIILSKFVNDLLYIYERLAKNQEINKIIISLITIFETKLLYLLGVQPNFKSCNECGNTNNLIHFDIKTGGMICGECLNKTNIHQNLDDRNSLLLREIYYKKISDITDDDLINKYSNINLWNIIDEYYRYHLEYNNKIKEVFLQIFPELNNVK